MITDAEFLAMPDVEKASLIIENLLAQPLDYPTWQTTGEIIEHLERLGLNVQISILLGHVNVSIYSYLGDESYLRGQVSLHHYEDPDAPSVGLNSEALHHHAVAMAALMVVNVIEINIP